MTDFIAEYGERLRVAARERHDLRRSRAHRRKLAAIGGAVALAVAAPAVAATGVWRPLLGDQVHEAPSAATDDVPAEQRQLLGVLQRPQSDEDRGPKTAYALQSLTAGVAGVRTAGIRLLRQNAGGHAVVLVPVAQFGLERKAAPAPLQAAPTRNDGLCLVATDTDRGEPAGASFGCYVTDQIRAGEAIAAIGQQVYGLVPDGVDSVSVRLTGDHVIDATVQDNLFTYTVPARSATRAENLQWRDGNGSTIKSVAGSTVPSPDATDPTTSLCDPAVPRDKCLSGNYAP